MRGDMSKPIIPVATAALLAGLLTTTAIVPPGAAATVQEDLTVTAGRNVTPEQEAVLSSAAGKVLRHIAQA